MKLLQYSVVCVMLMIPIIFSACSSNNAEELFKTAQFEELQNNRDHAAELYREIIDKYPDSGHVKTARERLAVLEEKKTAE